MKSAIVIGGGWAGLSCAVRLSESGFQVTVLEQSKRLGGRASSFLDEKTGQVIDNGQHLFMGCYLHTIDFLKTIGTLDKLKFQKNLSVDFVDKKGRAFSLDCPPLPSPFHLFAGILRLGTLTWREKLAMAKVYRAVAAWKGNGTLSRMTVEAWLISLGQSENSRKYFWDLITIAALNEQSSIAEADALAIVLKEAFFASKEKSQIAIASRGLSELLNPACHNFLASRQGRIQNDRLVSKIEIKNGRVERVVLRDGSALTADVYVSAVPFYILNNLLEEPILSDPFFGRMKNLATSPIFSITLWLDRDVVDQEFAALLGTHVQWLFNRNRIAAVQGAGSCLALVISGAREYLDKSNEEILKICLEELHSCFPKSRDAKLLHWLIQREKNATLSPKVGYSQFRLPQKTPVGNFFLCGDWTDTKYPATIESAVLSGVKASEAVLDLIRSLEQ